MSSFKPFNAFNLSYSSSFSFLPRLSFAYYIFCKFFCLMYSDLDLIMLSLKSIFLSVMSPFSTNFCLKASYLSCSSCKCFSLAFLFLSSYLSTNSEILFFFSNSFYCNFFSAVSSFSAILSFLTRRSLVISARIFRDLAEFKFWLVGADFKKKLLD